MFHFLGGRSAVRDKLAQAKCKCFGHFMRRERIESRALLGKTEGRKARGRQRTLWMDNIKNWLSMSLRVVVDATRDR